MSGHRVVVALVALGSALSFALPSPSGAAVPRSPASGDITAPVIAAKTPLPQAVAFLETALTNRSTALSGLETTVAAAKKLTVSDRAALDAILATAMSGIAMLAEKAPTEPNLASVRSDAAAMVLDYHVFSLVTPQVTIVIAADKQLNRLAVLDKQEPAIAAAIEAASQAHENVARERALDVTFRVKVALLSGLVSNLSATILALAPSSVPDSLATLTLAKGATVRAGDAANAAAAAEQRIVVLLAERGTKLSTVLRRLTATASSIASFDCVVRSAP